MHLLNVSISPVFLILSFSVIISASYLFNLTYFGITKAFLFLPYLFIQPLFEFYPLVNIVISCPRTFFSFFLPNGFVVIFTFQPSFELMNSPYPFPLNTLVLLSFKAKFSSTFGFVV